MTKRRGLLLAFAATVPFLLIFRLPPAIALALQTPGELVVKETLLRGEAAVVVRLLVSWLSLGLAIWVLGYIVTSRNRPAKVVALTVLSGLFVGVLFLGRSQEHKTFVGTFEHDFERSAFYPNGDCWRPPYFVFEMPRTPRIDSEAAVTVTFIGDASSIGSYGLPRTYLREVTVKRVLDVRPTEPCR